MPWLRIAFDPAQHDPERLACLLNEAGAAAVTFEDAADEPLLEVPPGATPLWSRTRVIGLFTEDHATENILTFLRTELGEEPPPHEAAILPDQDWERAWMEDFHPLRFGARLWIVPSWHEPPDPAAVNILLDPGLAFGTGTHPTTALCLEWLDGHAPAGKTVIDYGCGSGILAIAAAKLGAREVWAVDYDPQALLATAGNAERNEAAACLRIVDTDAPLPEADLLLANILAAPIMELAPRFAGHIRPGGRIVLSGILREQAEEILEKYRPWFTMEPVTVREEWVRLTGARR